MFTTVDGHRIHYEVQGDGEPLVLIAGTGFDMTFWEDLLPALRGFRILRLDNRGSGLSDVSPGRYSVSQMADDVAAVMDAAEFGSAHVYGTSLGSLIAQDLAVRHPGRVRSLVLGATSAGVTMVPGAPVLLPLLLRPLHYGAEESLRRSAPYLSNTPASPDPPTFFGHAGGDRSTEGYARQLRAQLRYSSLTKLRRIDAPTLVLHGEKDRVIPPANARIVARLIRGAQLRLIRGAGHLYALDNPGDATDAVLDFLLEHAERILEDRDTGARSGNAAVLFTDIVDSTTHLWKLGDARWLDLIERHNEMARRCVRELDGWEVKTTGDGVVAVFPEPSAGIACAQRLLAAVSELGLELRAGLHFGAFSLRDGDVHGLAVHAAARIASSARPGEVVVSEAIRSRCSGVAFVDRGPTELKGLPDSWRLYAAPAR